VSMNMSPSPSDPYITSMAIVPSKVARRMGWNLICNQI
jgi:hypothetical protein